jgi:hypothetical protein
VLSLAIAAFAVAAAETGERQIDELMRKSGLWEQVGQLQAQMKAGSDDERERAKAAGSVDLGDRDYARLMAAMNEVYAPDRMRAAVSRELAATLSVADEKEVLVWLSTDLGRRITRLEERQGEVEQFQKTEEEGPKVLAGLPKERVDKLRRLGEAIRIGDSTATMVINMGIATAYGAASAMPGGADEDALRALRSRFESQRPMIAAAMTERAILAYAYAYRELKDEELDRYIEFSETPAGRRYNDAAAQALDKALLQASLELGRKLGDLVRKEPDRRS